MTEKTASEEKFSFQAEVGQLLNIITHSVYSEKEIFIRELVSNASDACDKVRYQEMTNTDVRDKGVPLEVKLEVDKEKKTIKISDTGIGMSREEIMKNIGSIAHSGSKEFFTKLSEAAQKDVNLIGQFGVGFYSVFMVATDVRVTTLSSAPDAQAWEWRSDGLGSYTLSPSEKTSRGTEIEICLREDDAEYADEDTIKGIIKKHSNFVSYPIMMSGSAVNEVKAIWTQPKSQIKDEEYDEFYRFISDHNDKPLLKLHVSADAPIQFNSILFFPQMSFEALGMGEEEHGISLYTRKILIQNHCKELLPKYLRFVWGMVDSEDIPLNISRETLQENRVVSKISSVLVKKILDQLLKLAEDNKEEYLKIWNAFGKIMREGVTLDYQNRDKLAKLLRFNSSSKDDSEYISLEDYVKGMNDGQKEIYYAGGKNRSSIDGSPHIEIFKKKGIEVLYLFDPIDEFVLSALGTFGEKTIKSIDMKDIEVGKDADVVDKEEDANESLAFKSAFDGLLKKAKEVLGERVSEVKESNRLVDSPCCLLNPDSMTSTHMQKIMQMSNKDFSMSAMVMEFNRQNKLVRNLTDIFKDDPTNQFLDECCRQLYENSLMSEGLTSVDAHESIPRIQRFMEKASETVLSCK